jgi:heme/copper-type cytochrome/quinol oxidase subunit 2
MEIITSSFFEILIIVISAIIVSILTYIAVTLQSSLKKIELHNRLLYGEDGAWDGLISKMNRMTETQNLSTTALVGIIKFLHKNELIDCNDDLMVILNRLDDTRSEYFSGDKRV